MVKRNSTTPLLDFIFNISGVFLVIGGTILFYEGFNTYILTKVSSDPLIQFFIGIGMLFTAYVVFDKKTNIISSKN